MGTKGKVYSLPAGRYKLPVDFAARKKPKKKLDWPQLSDLYDKLMKQDKTHG